MDRAVLPFAPQALLHRMWQLADTMQQVAATMERSARVMDRAQVLAARSRWIQRKVASNARRFPPRAAGGSRRS